MITSDDLCHYSYSYSYTWGGMKLDWLGPPLAAVIS